MSQELYICYLNRCIVNVVNIELHLPTNNALNDAVLQSKGKYVMPLINYINE